MQIFSNRKAAPDVICFGYVDTTTKNGAAVRKDSSFSLSNQREIERHGLHVEFEVSNVINELGMSTLLHQSGIRQGKGCPPITLLFVLLVLPVIQPSLSSFCSASQHRR
jgi:hypothetical protein